MKIIIFLMVLVYEMISLSQATEFTFADVKTGQDILTANDNYFNRMSPAEIAIRSLSTVADKSADDLKAQYKANVLEWSAAEKAQITQLVADNRERLDRLNHLLPDKVVLIKVTDLVEGGMPHTRANAIILPESDKPLSEKLLYHELFHVLSRNQKARHDSLYSLIGFKSCDFTSNDEIKAKRLTNPDVPAESYFLPVEIDGKKTAVMTFLHAAKEAYDLEVNGGFGGHFGFGLLKVSVAEGRCKVDTDAGGKAQILSPADVADFFVSIGRNTRYIIHPEEVLADNFVIVMLGKEELPTPEIPQRLKEWLEMK